MAKNNKVFNFARWSATLPIRTMGAKPVLSGILAFKSSRTLPLCPNCAVDRFELISGEEGVEGTWQCPNCQLTAVTQDATIESLYNWYHQNAYEVFRNSTLINTEKTDDEEIIEEVENFKAQNVKKHMIISYICLAIALFVVFVMIYSAFNLNFFGILYCAVILPVFVMIGVSYNYRAWQADTGYIFSENGKAQFNWWLKTHPWFRYPKDIGASPYCPDANNDST